MNGLNLVRRWLTSAVRWLGPAGLVCGLSSVAPAAQQPTCTTTPPGPCYQVSPLGLGTNGQLQDDGANITSVLNMCSGGCTVALTSGSYNLVTGITVPSNTTLTSANCLGGCMVPDPLVILFRNYGQQIPSSSPPMYYMGPMITMSGTGETVSYLTVNGQNHTPWPSSPGTV